MNNELELNNNKISKGKIILISLLYVLLDIAIEILVLIPQAIKEMKNLLENGQEFSADEFSESTYFPWYGNLIKIALIVLIIYLFKKQSVDFFKLVELSKVKWGKITGLIISSLAITTIVETLILWLYPQFDTANQVALESTFQNSGALTMFLMLVILAPIGEEIMIRGVFIGVLFKEKPYLGLIVSSVLFALLHGPTDIPSFITYFVPGLTLGFIYIKTEWIMVPIIAHLLNNLFGYIMMYV